MNDYPWKDAKMPIDRAWSKEDCYDPNGILDQMDKIIQTDKNRSILLAGVTGTGKARFAFTAAKKYLGADTEGRCFHYLMGQPWNYNDMITGLQILEKGNRRYLLGRFTEACLAARSQSDKLVFFIMQQIVYSNPTDSFGEVYSALSCRDTPIKTRSGLDLTIPSNLVIIKTLTLGNNQPVIDDISKEVFHIISMEPQWSLEYLQKYTNSKNKHLIELVQIMGAINTQLKRDGLSEYQLGTRQLHQIIKMGRNNISDKDVMFGAKQLLFSLERIKGSSRYKELLQQLENLAK